MCKCSNPYIPNKAKIKEIIKHTNIEWTFRVETNTEKVKPGQFYEISLPKYGESPISVSGIGADFVDFTIRNVGRVTGELFKLTVGDNFLIRGPYGNGFDISNFIGKDLVIITGGSALAPVRGIIEYAYENLDKFKSFKLIVGFRSLDDVLFAADLKKWEEKLDILVTVDREDENRSCNVGLVTKYIPEIKFSDINELVAVVVGPPLMMKFSIEELKKLNLADKNIWVSYERKMHCGIGKCGHCKMDATYICLDGPVFNYEFAKNIAD